VAVRPPPASQLRSWPTLPHRDQGLGTISPFHEGLTAVAGRAGALVVPSPRRRTGSADSLMPVVGSVHENHQLRSSWPPSRPDFGPARSRRMPSSLGRTCLLVCIGLFMVLLPSLCVRDGGGDVSPGGRGGWGGEGSRGPGMPAREKTWFLPSANRLVMSLRPRGPEHGVIEVPSGWRPISRGRCRPLFVLPRGPSRGLCGLSCRFEIMYFGLSIANSWAWLKILPKLTDNWQL
jgi:hypothetical protein